MMGLEEVLAQKEPGASYSDPNSASSTNKVQRGAGTLQWILSMGKDVVRWPKWSLSPCPLLSVTGEHNLQYLGKHH